MSELTSNEKLIRKLRKKLREIERLEVSDRSSLNREEISKIKRKNAIREELSQLLDGKDQGDEGAENVSSYQSSPEKCLNKFANEFSNDSLPEKQNKSPELRQRKVNSAKTQSTSDEEMKRSNPEDRSSETVDKALKETENKRPKPDTELPVVDVEKSECQLQEHEPEKPIAQAQKKLLKSGPATKALEEKKWHETPFIFNYLDGHSDLVCCVDLDDDYVVSGSRDTLIQVWCAKTGSHLLDLRGHTNAITCISLLNALQSKELYFQLVEGENEEIIPRLVISTSVDCCIKLWNIQNGSALRSIYTFNGITALSYFPALKSCVIGSEGGKLEVYSLLPEHVHPLASHRAFEGPVSSIKVQSENLICSSVDGCLSVYVLRDSGLCRLYNLDDLLSENGELIKRRPILATAVASKARIDSPLYFGDEGSSIKVLTWKTGRIKKLRNHVHEFGQTNAIFTTYSYLLSSSINIDTGNSAINVFSMPQLNYLGTLSIAGLGRIVCLAAIEDEASKHLRIAVGGSKLTMIETKGIGCKQSSKKDVALKPKFIKDMSLPAGDSEEESSASSEEEDHEENEESTDHHNASYDDSKGSWCQIL